MFLFLFVVGFDVMEKKISKSPNVFF